MAALDRATKTTVTDALNISTDKHCKWLTATETSSSAVADRQHDALHVTQSFEITLLSLLLLLNKKIMSGISLKT